MRRLWRWLERRIGRADEELERELRVHLELEAEEQRQDGRSESEAHWAARRAVGRAVAIKEDVREAWGWASLDRCTQDVRYGVRLMGKHRTSTLIAVLSLALGIGGTTAVFSVLDAAVLRPMRVQAPERLVILQPTVGGNRFGLFNPFFEEIRRRQTSLEDIFAVSDSAFWKATFERATTPTYIRGSKVSGSYFRLLGLSPALGRLLTDADDRIGGTPGSGGCALVLSDAFWARQFNRDVAALGQHIRIGDTACTIVGVAPAGFQSVQPGFTPDVWGPIRALTPREQLENRSGGFFSGVMGRVRGRVTTAEAEAELTAIYQRVLSAEPPQMVGVNQRPRLPSEFAIRLLPGGHGLDGLARELGQPLLLLLAVVAMVLLIASVNVANLLLARGAVRAAELATRAALGAGRMRLVRQLTVEGTLMAACGGVLGVGLAWIGAPALASLVSLFDLPLPIALDTTPDHRVLLVALGATTLAALVSGALPALRLTGSNLQAAAASAGRTTGSRSGQRLMNALVGAQLALSLLLLTSTGLLLRTIVRLASIDRGFEPERVVVLDVRHEGASNSGEIDTKQEAVRLATLYTELDDRLNALPGVQSASLSQLGLFGGNDLWTRVRVVGGPNEMRHARVDYVSARYVETVGMRLLRGRGLTRDDRMGAPNVAVVNEAFANEWFGNRDVLGRRLTLVSLGDDTPSFTIVGIVGDSKYNDLREDKAEPMVWVPLSQAPTRIRSVSLRAQPGADVRLARDAQRALAAVDKAIMVRTVATLSARVAQSTGRERLLLGLASAFGALALLLAAIGLYGTLAHAVTRRTRELGVRLALGAQRGAVVRMVVRDALRLALWGALLGIPLSLAAGHALRALLFGVEPHDAAALSGACVLLTLVVAIAAYVPARRASQISPMEALRYE